MVFKLLTASVYILFKLALSSISTERHRAEVRRAVNDERLNTIAYQSVDRCMQLTCARCSGRNCNFEQMHFHFSMSGPNSSSEWSIEGRRLVPLMPRLVPQTAFTVTANAVANATAHQNASLPVPAETGNKEGATTSVSFSSVCFSENNFGFVLLQLLSVTHSQAPRAPPPTFQLLVPLL